MKASIENIENNLIKRSASLKIPRADLFIEFSNFFHIFNMEISKNELLKTKLTNY